MTETQKRINAYREALPNQKAKVTAILVILLFAAVMAVGATFAWVVLSRSPEVKGIPTSVAANGNLEIALALEDGSAPGSSQVGDSASVNENGVLGANRTWGNLVNLSDPSYGLGEVILRPASLNSSGLLTNPLNSAQYDAGGRYDGKTNANYFRYVYYDKDYRTFRLDKDSDKYGVRAISTIRYENLEAGSVLNSLTMSAEDKFVTADDNYNRITNNQIYINALQGLIQAYAQMRINSNSTVNNTPVTDYIPDLYAMMQEVNSGVMEPLGESYLAMAHMCEFKYDGREGTEVDPYDYQTVDALYEAAGTLPDYIKIDSLAQFAKDVKQLQNYLNPEKTNSLAYWAEQASGGTTVYWKDIQSIVNWVCDINSCIIDGYPMSSISGHMMDIVNNRTHSAVIHGGFLYRTEDRIERSINVKIKITVKSDNSLIGTQTLDNIYITTSAQKEKTVRHEINEVNKSDSWIAGKDGTAEDTYAYAIDFYVRTNAAQSYLTLEGNLRTEEQTIRATDKMGHELYTVSWKDGQGEEQTARIYEEGGVYYFADTQEVAPIPDDESAIEIRQAMETVTVVVGYEGDNRIWTDDQMAGYIIEGGKTATTQGSGSCYVFYANNSADQERFLSLLANLKVVFIDEDGNKMATAITDTEHYYAETGKITVPLVLSSADSVQVDENYYITELKQNEAKRVTALVYLDGDSVENSMVHSSQEVSGTLNIQFGSSEAPLNTMENEALMSQYISVSATVSEKTFEFNSNSSLPKTKLTVTVDGEIQDSSKLNVRARFVRKITDTYGSWQQEIILVKDSASANTWTGDYAFRYPGTYILRSVSVNGDEYSLAEPIEVTVNGALIGVLSFADTTARTVTKMTADSSYSAKITLASCKESTAKIVFVNVDNSNDRVTVNMKRTGTSVALNGTATFKSSGTYVAQFYNVDGEEYVLDPSMYLSLKLYLGLKAETRITCDPDVLSILKLVQDRATPTNFVMPDSVALAQDSLVMSLLTRIGDNEALQTHCKEEAEIVDALKGALREDKNVANLDKAHLEQLDALKDSIDALLNSENEGIELFALSSNILTDENRVQFYNLRDDLTLLSRLCTSTDSINDIIDGLSSGTITLHVACKIYDNSGSVITDPDDVKLFYSKAGSSLSTSELHAELKLDSEAGEYQGNFRVSSAGIYNFSRVTVTIEKQKSDIARYTSAPSIRAMPPADAYYYGKSENHQAYQFAPSGNAVMKVNIAYSSAAEVVATIKKDDGDDYKEIIGTMGQASTDQDGISFNEWSFEVPKIMEAGAGIQDGNWTLKSITMRGVYYDGVFYGEDSNGVTVDLEEEAVKTKVVQRLRVTLTGKSQELTGKCFMENNTVSGTTVTIVDFEGEAIRGVEITNVGVTYKLDKSAVGLETYGYKLPEGFNENVTVTAMSQSKSGPTYAIDNLVFKYAGPYTLESVAFYVNNEEGKKQYTSSDQTVILTVVDVAADETPDEITYDVKWTAPTVTVTATKPAPDKKITINIDTRGSTNLTAYTSQNYFEDYYVYVHEEVSTLFGSATGYTMPKATLQLTNAGDQISKTNTVTLQYSAPSYPNVYNTWVFSGDNTKIEGQVGALDGNSRRQITPKVTVNTVTIKYDGKDYTVKLSHALEFTENSLADPTFKYDLTGLSDDIIQEYDLFRETKKDITGRGITITFPKIEWKETVTTLVEETKTTYHYKQITQPIKWTVTNGCGETEDRTGYQVTTLRQTVTEGTLVEVERTTTVDEWSVASTTHTHQQTTTTKTVKSGTTTTYSISDHVATPKVIEDTSEPIGDPFKGSSVTNTEKTVVYKSGNDTIVEPSIWEINGVADVVEWDSDT